MKPSYLAGALLGLAVLIAGCTSQGGGTTTEPSIVTNLDSPASSPTGAAGPTTAPPEGAPTYPATAKAYAEAIIAAWKAKDQAKLATLTTTLVEDQIIGIPLPNMSWTFIRCDGAAGSTHCSFYNADGHVINLRISNALLGKADAGTAVTYAPTVYPAQAKDYVEELLKAWRDDNGPRMRLLAKQEVVVVLAEGVALKSWTFQPITCCGGGLAIVKVDGPNGAHLQFHVGTTLLSQPKAVIALG